MQPNKLGLLHKVKARGHCKPRCVYALTQKSSSILTITSIDIKTRYILNIYVKGYKKIE